ncbi:MAG: ATP-binding protein [Clostridiales bacterium]|nr:ATP-binding protein [Clostridiales bacterium]
MTKRIFRAICLVSLAVFLASVTLIMGILYDYFSRVQLDQLRIEAGLAARGVEENGTDYFDGLDTQSYRITWIGADGTVLFDSTSDADVMENHLDREEVKQAIASGYGHSSRYSSTLMERLLYSAQRLNDGSVIRLSITQNSVLTIVLGMIQPVLLVSLVAVILALVLSSSVSKSVVRPLNELNLDEPLNNEGFDELSPLLRRIDSQQRQLKGQALELRQKQDEFLAVTSNMSEGLVLLNAGGTILSINNAALNILGADKSCVGEDILTVNRSLEMQKLLEQAKEGNRSETKLCLSGREYQLDASPIIGGGNTRGVALLLFDITERENAEQLRREFTANVSHELKTPLHSISGCAELMKNGMVRPEDTARFAGQIYSEAQRLIHLVEDIIHLSRLDEGAEDMQRERIDLYALSGSVIDSLGNEAKENKVSLELCGGPAYVWGVRQLVSGMVYNLCDNAIKYNRENGSVKLSVSCEGEYSVLNVSDTGIGIPPEHQSRVFERFYRVDKSHSKEVGGTGLGLSIVKHSAMVHNAKIDLQSTAGKGTSITVRFPKA